MFSKSLYDMVRNSVGILTYTLYSIQLYKYVQEDHQEDRYHVDWPDSPGQARSPRTGRCPGRAEAERLRETA